MTRHALQLPGEAGRITNSLVAQMDLVIEPERVLVAGPGELRMFLAERPET